MAAPGREPPPPGNGRPPDALPWAVVVGAGLALLAMRLWRLDTAPFGRDEPMFLAAAREQLRSGSWRSASPISGTQGLRYGPTVIWLYGAVQWLFGDAARTAIAAMVVLTSVSQVALATALARLVRHRTAVFLGLVVLIASSPYLWFWSRLAWDQSVLVCAATTVAVLVWSTDVGRGQALAVGALLGLAVSSHPMVTPFAVSVVVVLAVELRHRRRELCWVLGIVMGTVFVLNLPYLHYLLTHSQDPASPASDLSQLPDRLSQAPGVLSPMRISYYFDTGWSRFLDQHPAASFASALAGVVVVALLALSIVGLVDGGRSDDRRRRRLAALAGLTWVLSAALFVVQGVPEEPHYQFAVWWVVPAGLALCTDRLVIRPTWRVPTMAVVAVVAVVNLCFLVGWISLTSGEDGTRGTHYDAAVASQERIAREMCSSDQPLHIVNETAAFPEPLAYLRGSVPGCEDLEVTWCDAPCTPRASGRVLRLQYEPGRSARLRLVDG